MATYGYLWPPTTYHLPGTTTTYHHNCNETTTNCKEREEKFSLFISILFRITNYNQINKTKINKLLDFHVFIFLYFYIVSFFSSFSSSF